MPHKPENGGEGGRAEWCGRREGEGGVEGLGGGEALSFLHQPTGCSGCGACGAACRVPLQQ